jgi:bacillithiol biosynthesis cysteine-adding enzyme BshC
MHKTGIDFSETGNFSKLILDYLNGNPDLSPFYKYTPALESFKKAMDDKGKETIDRPLLQAVLKEQNSPFQHFTLVQKNIDLIKQPNSFTVTTGHQLCAFTGPLYFIYKIISTIVLSRKLKEAYPDCNFIPVYWLASEDHDFEEVNHIHLYGKKIVWEQEQKGATGPITTHSLKPVLETLQTLMGTSENASSLMAIFEKSYSKPNLSDATRYLVSELFCAYGLLVIDASDARLKKVFSKIIKADFIENENFRLVHESIEALSKQQVKAQVTPRKVNCFYMLEGLRERIEQAENGYIVCNTSIHFTKAALLSELENHPERFSPNVVLRPLYQEKIMPNLAYIGGPGELAYWFEYKKMFEFHKINFPVLMLRNCALLIDKTSIERLNKMQLQAHELFIPLEDLIKLLVKKNGADYSFVEEEENLKATYESIKTKAEKVDITLKGMVEAELQKQINALKGIEGKVLKAEKLKQEVSINQLKKIKEKLFPDNKLQERHENFIPYYIQYGEGFIKELLEIFDPFEKQFLLLSE